MEWGWQRQALIWIEKGTERNKGGQTRDRKRYWWIYKEQDEIKKTGLKEIGVYLPFKKEVLVSIGSSSVFAKNHWIPNTCSLKKYQIHNLPITIFVMDWIEKRQNVVEAEI